MSRISFCNSRCLSKCILLYNLEYLDAYQYPRIPCMACKLLSETHHFLPNIFEQILQVRAMDTIAVFL